MPITRSEAQAQATLQFSCRRSCRLSSGSKMPQLDKSSVSLSTRLCATQPPTRKTRKTNAVGKVKNKIPSTHTQDQAQPMLPFPRRKSARVSFLSKMPQLEKSSTCSSIKPEQQHLTTVGPLNPLSARHCAADPAPPSSSSLPARLPLRLRKRTGDNSSCNPAASRLGSPSKQRKLSLVSSQKLDCDENSPVLARHPQQPFSATAGLFTGQEETPTGLSCQNSGKKPREETLKKSRIADNTSTEGEENKEEEKSQHYPEEDVLWIDTSRLSPIPGMEENEIQVFKALRV